MAEVIRATEVDEALELGRSAWGRARAGLGRAALTFPLGMLALAVVLLPDYLGRFRHTEPVAGLYWASLALMALLLAVIVGAVGSLRRELWIFDGPARELRVRVSLIAGTQEAAVPLRDIQRLELVEGGRGGFASLDVILAEDRRETLAKGYFLAERLEDVGEATCDYLKKHRFQVALSRVAASGER